MQSEVCSQSHICYSSQFQPTPVYLSISRGLCYCNFLWTRNLKTFFTKEQCISGSRSRRQIIIRIFSFHAITQFNKPQQRKSLCAFFVSCWRYCFMNELKKNLRNLLQVNIFYSKRRKRDILLYSILLASILIFDWFIFSQINPRGFFLLLWAPECPRKWESGRRRLMSLVLSFLNSSYRIF